jgi:endogenous inhibitor of DNA gyrase (YacG/DUF329 family)
MIRARCPICNRWLEFENPAAGPDLPFCSARCRLIDLGRWLGEEYRITPATDTQGQASAEEDGFP